MKRKLILAAVAVALVLGLVTAGTALAKGLKEFVASGAIEQTAPGSPLVPAPLSSVEPFVPPEMYGDVVYTLEAYGGADTPGMLTEGQFFEGSLTDSNWGAVKKADVEVAHNSWWTADFETGELVGLAWGTFDLSKGKGNALTGGYAAVIQGWIWPDPTTCPTTRGNLYVSVTDTGGWQLVPGSTSGAYKQVSGGGDLTVTASGCLRDEAATIEVAGVRGKDD